MALLNNTPAFETEDDAAGQPAPTVATTPAAAVAVVRPQTGGLITSSPAAAQILALKDAMPVDYNTLPQLKASQGNLIERETNAKVGDIVTAKLVSYQDSYIVSTGDDNKDKTLLRFSNDGIHCTDGSLVQEHIDLLRNKGFSKANCKKRCVVVMLLLSANRQSNFVNELVQLDLAPSSMILFQRYISGVAVRAGMGTLVGDPTVVKLTCETRKKDTNDYTVVLFTTADADAAA